jgi:hypothetical protein
VAAEAVQVANNSNPITTSVVSATRNWTDLNHDYVVVRLYEPGPEQQCGPLSN